jgi:thiosulfate reductase cytochrome b subunit
MTDENGQQVRPRRRLGLPRSPAEVSAAAEDALAGASLVPAKAASVRVEDAGSASAGVSRPPHRLGLPRNTVEADARAHDGGRAPRESGRQLEQTSTASAASSRRAGDRASARPAPADTRTDQDAGSVAHGTATALTVSAVAAPARRRGLAEKAAEPVSVAGGQAADQTKLTPVPSAPARTAAHRAFSSSGASAQSTSTTLPAKAPVTRPEMPMAANRISAARTYRRHTVRGWILRGVIAAPVLAFAVLIFVFAVRYFLSLDFMREFVATYPGETHLPEGAPVGLPAWLGWQHFLNAFFIVLIIRTGWLVRTQQRPPATWVRNDTGVLKTKNPPKRISINLWAHLAFDVLWLLNGVVFVTLLFASGQWMRVVPTSWDVVPNAVSAGLQYASLDWPTENGWVNYNSLQVLAYFTTIFLAAPLAALTGVRMSGAWPANATWLNRVYPVKLARAIHFPVMLYFVAFIVVHVALVFATGALRNLNHMYAAQDAVNWWGFGVFVLSLLLTAAAVVAARPFILSQVAGLMGKVGR